MLSFCGFMILVMIGFLFVKKENKKKMITLIQDNIGLFGAALFLLFLVRGVSNFKVEGYGGPMETYAGYDEEEERIGTQCGGNP
jgi:hypothetical protein